MKWLNEILNLTAAIDFSVNALAIQKKYINFASRKEIYGIYEHDDININNQKLLESPQAFK